MTSFPHSCTTLDSHYRTVSNTLERDQIFTAIYHDLKNPQYPEDFDYVRAEADLASILSGNLIDAYPLERVDGKAIIPNSGYGFVMKSQLPTAVKKLQSDPDTRQASVVFWDGQGSPSCTLGADFKVRQGVLNAVFWQRSSDESQLYFDLYNFTGITHWVYERLNNVELGQLVLITTSLHRYV